MAGELAQVPGLTIIRRAAPDPAVAARAVLDMRHPFALPSRLDSDAPILRYLRPEWVPEAGDRWTAIPDATHVATITNPGDVVFVATGRGRLGEMSGLRDRVVWWRRRGPVETAFPFAQGGWLTETGPFTVAEERALFEQLGVDWLVLQNAGGEGARPKLDAARDLGLRVAMIARPAPPPGAVADLDTLRAWLRDLDIPFSDV